MPTGYTSKLHDGEQTFPQFAATCARAFGALILLRDDPLSDELPSNAGEESNWHDQRLKIQRARLLELESCSPESAKVLCDAEYASALESYEQRRAKNAAMRARYEAMLADVERWTAPTQDHEGMKKFMREQLQESIRFDCWEPDAPTQLAPDAWLASQIDATKKSIAYHEDEKANDEERHRSRNAWLEALRESLNTWQPKREP